VPHLDLSIWAFEKLASTKWGVIPLRWRAVPCDHKPTKAAPPPTYPTPGQSPPAGAKNPASFPQENLAPTKKWSQQQGSDQKMYEPYATYAEAMAAISSGSQLTTWALLICLSEQECLSEREWKCLMCMLSREHGCLSCIYLLLALNQGPWMLHQL
jgi:hypothetical protein